MKNHARLLEAETVGTALMMIGGPGSAVLGGLHPGAQVNPAVTLGLLLARRVDGQQATMTWIGQTLGAVIGDGLVLVTAVLTVASDRHAWATVWRCG